MLKKLSLLLAAMLIVAVPSLALAQDEVPDSAVNVGKPIAAVSISSVDDLRKQISATSQTFGLPLLPLPPLPPEAIDGMIQQLGFDPNLPGLDQTKPIVAAVFLPGGGLEGMPGVCLCLPTTDKDQLLATVRAKDNGDGTFTVFDMPAFVKESNGYLLAAVSPAILESMPADPTSLVGELPANYLIAVRGIVQNVPKEFRDGLTDLLEAFIPEEAVPGVGGPDLAAQLARLQRFINDTSDIVVGLGTDETEKSIFLDFSSTAVPGSETAKAYGNFKPTPSRHAGVLMPEAAVTLLFSAESPKTPEDVAAIDVQHQARRSQALDQLDADAGVPAAVKEAAKQAVGKLIDVAYDTLKADSVDIAAALVLDDKSTLVIGGDVADGDGLAASLKQVADIAQQDGLLPPIRWDDEKHKGYALHAAQIPVDNIDEDFERLVGDNFSAVLATSADSVYLAVGGDAVGRVKKVIDVSAAAEAPLQEPLRINVALEPIIGIAAPELLEKLAKTGGIRLTVEGIENGVRTRIKIDEAALKALISLGLIESNSDAAEAVEVPFEN
ncbi:MAG: hypothetical protein VB853_09065 [Pirellulales bacterium]